MHKLGIIGLGYWGPNYLRIFSREEETRVVACADIDAKHLASAQRQNPSLKTFADYRDLLKLKEINAVIVVTPTGTHYEIVRNALEAGKHVLVEKPLATDYNKAKKLCGLAKKNDLVLFTGHTFLFNSGINRIKESIKSGQLGDICYLHAVRTNLGPIRRDVNAMVDLATHDIAIFLHLLGEMPEAVSAQGEVYINEEKEDVAFVVMYFPGNILCHIHVSWLEPRKVRQITVIGDKKMLVFDDMNTAEPIKIYDKGAMKTNRAYRDFNEFKTTIWDGDVVIPKVNMAEPLRNQCVYFIDLLKSGDYSPRDGDFSMNVVKILEAANKSMKKRGKLEYL
jgi:predicted dehydrogenase